MSNYQYIITGFTKLCQSKEFKTMIKDKLNNYNWVYLKLRDELKL